MRIAVTGVSGFIGSVIARHSHAAGHAVTGLVRATSRRDHVEPYVDRFVVGDQADETVWPALLDGADVLVHNSVDWDALKQAKTGDTEPHLRRNLLGSLRLLDASAPRRFVFISTIAVHHDMRPRWAGRIDEDHPMRPGTRYGAYKAAVESHLWSAHFGEGRETVALRPCGVYGLDPNLERSIGHPILRDVAAGRGCDRAGGGKFVHVDDVAAATVAACTRDDVAGRVFNLADCYARWSDWAIMAAEVLGVEVDVDHVSPAQSKNVFEKDEARSIGVELDRGFEGIRAHLAELARASKVVAGSAS